MIFDEQPPFFVRLETIISKESQTRLDVRTITQLAMANLVPGSQIGDHVIDALVGAGGFSTVFRGHVHTTGEQVAIKVLRPELLSISTVVLRFRREAETLAKLHHPSIVKVMEIDEISRGLPYLVMEWIEGHTLSEELRRRGSFSSEELLGVLEPLCGALAAAHEVGIVHRDIKPSNVMVTPEGDWFRIKLVDFGIAKMLVPEGEAARTKLTAVGSFMGTTSYMAPEQFIGARIDERTDIYALGILSYLLLAGKLPFQASTQMEMMDLHLLSTPPLVSGASRAPRALDPVIARALAKEPSARQESVPAFLDEVRRALRGPSSGRSASAGSGTGWMGVHVAAVFNGLDEDINDEVLVEIEDALALAQTELEVAGLRIVPETGNAILAVREGRLGEDDLTSLLNVALALRQRLVGAYGHVFVAITVHATPDKAQMEGLRWTPRSPWGATSATREVLAHVEARFELQAIEGVPDKHRVVRLQGGA